MHNDASNLVITVFFMTTKTEEEMLHSSRGSWTRHEGWPDGLAEEDVWHLVFDEPVLEDRSSS